MVNVRNAALEEIFELAEDSEEVLLDVLEVCDYHKVPVRRQKRDFVVSSKNIQVGKINEIGSGSSKEVFGLDYPEAVIGTKKLNDGKIVAVSSRNVVYLLNEDYKVLETVRSDYTATSISCLIRGDSWSEVIVTLGSVMGPLIDVRPSAGSNISRVRNGHKGMIFAIAADSRRIFSVSDDRTLRMWCSETDEEISCSYGHTARPFAICVDETSRRIFTGGVDQAVLIWSYTDSEVELKKRINVPAGTIRKIILLDGDVLLISAQDGSLLKISIDNDSEVEVDRDILNFARVGPRFCTLSVSGVFCVYDEDQELVFAAENVKNSSSGSAVAWSRNILYVVDEERVFQLEMSSTVITAITYDDYVAVKLMDGFMRIYQVPSEGDSDVVFIGCCQLPRMSMMPANFLILKNFVVMGTNHGELYHTRIESTEKVAKMKLSVEKKILINVFSGKEVSSLRSTSDDCFMALGKTGTWSFFKIEDDKVILMSFQTFSSASRMAWPWQFLEISGRRLIAGFHGTCFVLLDADTRYPVAEVPCGGGHRPWCIHPADGDPNTLIFEFLRDATILRRIISLDAVSVISDALHTSAVVASASTHDDLIVTVALDGSLTLSDDYSDKKRCRKRRTIFAGENLLCVDVQRRHDGIYVITGGGKSKICTWKFSDDMTSFSPFWCRSTCREDDGRVVSVKIFDYEEKTAFAVSYSSGAIEILTQDEEGLTCQRRIELPEDVGMCSKFEIASNTLHAATTGSYLLSYDISNGKMKSNLRLKKRSGVTSMVIVQESEALFLGFDLGEVILVRNSTETEAHSHTATVVGIAIKDKKIYSTSLDCDVICSEFDTDLKILNTTTRSTSINAPSSILVTRNSNVIVFGESYECS